MPLSNNKVVLTDGTVIIDLTQDTVQADKLAEGYTAHDKSGALIQGTNTFDSDTSNDTAIASEVLLGKTAHARGSLLTGTMPNNGAVSGTIDDKDTPYTVPAGYHDGSGQVVLDPVEVAKLLPGNIKEGVELFSVVGSYTGEGVSAQSKIATPTFAEQVILPDQDYDYLSQVTVNPITVTYTENSAGGNTVTIG